MITVTIWRKTLVRLGACADGIAIVDAMAAMQPDSDRLRLKRLKWRWTPLHQVWLRAVYPSHSAWLYERGLIPGADLRGANLRSANLEGADLYGANLRGANLEGANLRSANLEGANLYGANLYGANLYGANLYGANLYGANLYGANLRSANLRSANLEGANLEGANLYGAYHPIGDLPNGWSRGTDGYLVRS